MADWASLIKEEVEQLGADPVEEPTEPRTSAPDECQRTKRVALNSF